MKVLQYCFNIRTLRFVWICYERCITLQSLLVEWTCLLFSHAVFIATQRGMNVLVVLLVVKAMTQSRTHLHYGLALIELL